MNSGFFFGPPKHRLDTCSGMKMAPRRVLSGVNTCKNSPQRSRRTLADKDAHSGRGGGTERRVLQHGPHWLERDAWKPLDKLGSERGVFEIFEPDRDRNPRATKRPSIADTFRVMLYSRTSQSCDKCYHWRRAGRLN